MWLRCVGATLRPQTSVGRAAVGRTSARSSGSQRAQADKGPARQRPDRGVQDLGDVRHRERVRRPRPAPWRSAASSRGSPRPAGRRRSRRPRCLARAELGGGLGLHQVVDPSRAAAGAAVGDVDQRDAGDAAQQGARLGRDSLGVAEVARVVVGDRQLQLGPWRDRPEFGQELAEVANPAAERRSPLGPEPDRRPASDRTPSWPSRSRPR